MKYKIYFTAIAGLLILAKPSFSAAAGATLNITCSPPAYIAVDGQLISPKPQTKTKFNIDAGKHILSAHTTGYQEESVPLNVLAGLIVPLNIVLCPQDQKRDEMTHIKGGTLHMGIDAKRAQWIAERLGASPKELTDQQPAHNVEVKDFSIDKYEVTNGQYLKFVQATNHRPPKHWRDGTYPEGQENHPVVNVSYEDADAYAKWAKKRLPTEAEWEMAARGGTDHVFPWGQVFRDDDANLSGSIYKGPTITGRYERGVTSTGCRDMAGNAAEWTASWYETYPGQSAADPVSGKQTHRVIRGGSWKSKPYQATAVARDKAAPNTISDHIGFRCVK